MTKVNKIYLDVSITGFELLQHPLLNKGTSFSETERKDFNLSGLLPPHIGDIEEQCQRSYMAFKARGDDLQRYIYLRSLQDSNETLFYALLTRHITEMLPIIYTPTVGLACQNFSQLYRRPRGLFLSPDILPHLDHIFANKHFDKVKVIVVSDGERILGLGDQGAGGMGIPIGKLSLYTVCAGIHPRYTLPILLDVGTDNQTLLNDPLYIGYRQPRIRDAAYDDFIEQFIVAVKKRFPDVLLQWEDFAQHNATRLLHHYQNQLCSFNDDIQGTAAIVLATLLSALHVTGKTFATQKIVIFGAGSAGCGIAEFIVQAMQQQGISEAEARACFFLVDRSGLLHEGTSPVLSFQKKFLQSPAHLAYFGLDPAQTIDLATVVEKVKPSILIGVSGQAGAFTESIIRTMATHVAQPIIFALSNPHSQCEAAPKDLLKWTNGTALLGAGSPFPPVEKNGKMFRIDQTNNSYIFPGIGLGLITGKVTHVTNSMLMKAAETLAELSPALRDKSNNLLPPLEDIRTISAHIAFAVIKEAWRLELSQLPHSNDAQLKQTIADAMWEPIYPIYRKI